MKFFKLRFDLWKICMWNTHQIFVHLILVSLENNQREFDTRWKLYIWKWDFILYFYYKKISEFVMYNYHHLTSSTV